MKKTFLLFSMILMVAVVFGQTVPREMVALEIGTGTWCQYCPGAAMGADDLLENGKFVGVIENHNGDSYANSYSNGRNSYYGISSFPTAKFDGVLQVVGGSHSSSMYSSYLPKYNNRIAVPSDVIISMEVTADSLDYTAVITLEKTPDWDAATPVLQFTVTQSNIQQNWQGQTHLEHVNRLMVPGVSGTPVDFGTGTTQVITLNFTLDEDWPVEDCEFVVFVQDNTGKEIHQTIKRGAIDLNVGYDQSATVINKDDTVHFSNMTFGGYIGTPETYLWHFPGAIPASSTVKNPTVTYTHCGTHDVTLIVNRGGQIDTLTKPLLIQVGPLVTITATPNDSACVYQPITLDATTATGTGYLWTPGNETTPSIVVDGNVYGPGTHVFTCEVTTSDGCVQEISQTIFFDACTGISTPEESLSALVYPNPNAGVFSVELSGTGVADLKIINMIGNTLYAEKDIPVSGKTIRNLNLDLPAGLYYMILQHADGKVVRKFSVTR